ncbi:MAG: hypothetical protein WCI39_13490 [Gallionellaceae bacterium]
MKLASKNLNTVKIEWSRKLLRLSDFFSIQLRKLLAWLGVFLTLWIYPAFGVQAASKESGSGAFLILLLVAFAPWFYTANKWRLWKLSFDIGSASGAWFFSALKWTVISLVWTVSFYFLLTFFK